MLLVVNGVHVDAKHHEQVLSFCLFFVVFVMIVYERVDLVLHCVAVIEVSAKFQFLSLEIYTHF